MTSYSLDVICGKPQQTIDWNGITETHTYDAFCRDYDVTNSSTGKFTKTRYENEGNPLSQAVVVYEPSSSRSSVNQIFRRTYYDGLARPWRVQTYGDTRDGNMRVTDTAFDPRGNVGMRALPRFANENPQWGTNAYDWRDRLVRTTNVDGSFKAYIYRVATETFNETSNRPVTAVRVTDEEGKVRRSFTDKDGNTILDQGLLGSDWISEFRSYDVLGRLKAVRDPGGAIWTYTYDMIGNRLTASDP
ncbi:RHS repeat domain-containing protein, partial [Xaviernesmea oryzae]|uniref:RHS repeat domain-containing protein n=1 Tax=Xaviernesmea oryzae TaxID=464029 RepID=UPI000A616DFC